MKEREKKKPIETVPEMTWTLVKIRQIFLLKQRGCLTLASRFRNYLKPNLKFFFKMQLWIYSNVQKVPTEIFSHWRQALVWKILWQVLLIIQLYHKRIWIWRSCLTCFLAVYIPRDSPDELAANWILRQLNNMLSRTVKNYLWILWKTSALNFGFIYLLMKTVIITCLPCARWDRCYACKSNMAQLDIYENRYSSTLRDIIEVLEKENYSTCLGLRLNHKGWTKVPLEIYVVGIFIVNYFKPLLEIFR